MPDYEYEALDSSGELVTGSVICSGEKQALEELEEFGLNPTKLTLRKKTPQAPVSQFWDGTFDDGAGWLGYGVAIPILGLFIGLEKFGATVPTIASILCFAYSFYHIRVRWRDGRWPTGRGVGGGGGCGGGCGGGGCGGGG